MAIKSGSSLRTINLMILPKSKKEKKIILKQKILKKLNFQHIIRHSTKHRRRPCIFYDCLTVTKKTVGWFRWMDKRNGSKKRGKTMNRQRKRKQCNNVFGSNWQSQVVLNRCRQKTYKTGFKWMKSFGKWTMDEITFTNRRMDGRTVGNP